MQLKFYEKIMTAQSALDAKGPVLGVDHLPNVQQVAVYIKFGAGTASGSVVVEGAHDPAYTGTWSNIATVAWAAADRVHMVAITGLHRALRVRISVVIGGGTVDAWAMGN